MLRSLDQHRSYLLALAWRRIAPALRTTIEPADLVQETFLHAVRSDQRRPFAGKTVGDFRRWLHAILLHQLTHAISRANAAKRDPRRTESIDIRFDAFSRECDPAFVAEIMEGAA